jgi:GNAT superfamily N-acetyltransferase
VTITVLEADGAVLDRILDTTHAIWHQGLTLPAYRRYHAAQMSTAWGRDHQHWFALLHGSELLASAKRYDLAGVLGQRRVRICGIGTVFTEPMHRGQGHAQALVHSLLDQARDEGADLALLFSHMDANWFGRNGFAEVPMTEVAVDVAQPLGRGAPMTLVRAGEERDLAAIVAMGQVRAGPFRFHLDRDVDLVRFAITRERLRAGLGSAGSSQIQFFIAEEGITAAAYLVLQVVGDTWRIKECGDRDPGGARVGAILQALIAREPAERRPSIRGWLPPGFVPPQVTIVAAAPSPSVMWVRRLGTASIDPPLSRDDVVYWPSDVF